MSSFVLLQVSLLLVTLVTWMGLMACLVVLTAAAPEEPPARGAGRGVRERAYLRAFGQAVIGLVTFRSTPPARLLRRAALMGRIALAAAVAGVVALYLIQP